MKRKTSVDAEAVEPKRMKIPKQEWGKYPLEARVNVDQVPFNLDNNANRSFFHISDRKNQISGTPGSDKRFGTLQIAVHGGTGPLPPLCIIFKGKGMFLAGEKESYHPKVVLILEPAVPFKTLPPAVPFLSQACFGKLP